MEILGEKLKEDNQKSQADDIHRLSTLYNSLLEQAHQATESTTMAVNARRGFEHLIGVQEELVKEQDEVITNIMSCGLPLNERIETLKVCYDSSFKKFCYCSFTFSIKRISTDCSL